jgi:uncharacterized membrane protein
LKNKINYHFKEGKFVGFWFALSIFLFLQNESYANSVKPAERFWLWEFFGKLHPTVVHFPIAILLFSALLELLSIKKYNSKFRPAIILSVYIGTSSAIVSAIFGLLLASSDDTKGQVLDLHKWSGIASSVGGVLSSIILYFIEKKRDFNLTRIYRFLLFATAAGVSFAGHFGGTLTHGEVFLTEGLPWNKSTNSSQSLNFPKKEGDLNLEDQLKLVGDVRAVFAHNCYKCHSSNKQEGKLRLDKKEYAFLGGKNGKVIVPGNSAKSELLRRVKLPKGHKEAMPGKGKPLTQEEIELLTYWIEKDAPWPEGALPPNLFRVAKLEPRKPTLPLSSGGLNNPIDLWTNEYFKKHQISWRNVVNDRIYIKRVYLDLIGLLPNPSEIELFLKDTNPQKREILVRNLLNRNEDYTQHWLTFWNDALRNDYTGPGYITKGRFNITDWLYMSLKFNKPYNLFAKELLSPKDASKGFIAGIQWRGSVNSSQSVEMQAAQNVGQVLLGLNLKCASCHDSFVSDWKLEDAYAFANIFGEKRLQIYRCDKPTGRMADTRLLWQNLGSIDSTLKRTKRLEVLAEKLIQPANGRIYRTLVNRIWKQMMGRGIVEPVDEMDNEPWSQDLLDWLAVDFVEKGYNIKELIYLIATSKTYQLPAESYQSQNLLKDKNFKFKGIIERRITAEQFSDAISQIITPVFDLKERKYHDSTEIVMFSRASLVANNPFLTALGRPNREVVITSRESQASLLQSLELTNGEKLNTVLKKGASEWKTKYRTTDLIIKKLYKKAFGRMPTLKEYKTAEDFLGKNPEVGQIQDFLWAILLLPEFQLIQ